MIEYILSLPIKIALKVLRVVLRNMKDHEKENMFLRYQILVLKRQTKKPRFKPIDRAILTTTALSMNLKRWRDSCMILKPATIVAWHKKLIIWKWSYRKSGRPSVPNHLKLLVIRMRKENILWGGKRIHGELLKLRYRISESTVRNILRAAGFNPLDPAPELSWKEFLNRHRRIWAIDFFTIETAFLKTIYVFAIIEIQSRRLIALRTTEYPNSEFVINVIRSELLQHQAPELLIRDRDGCFGQNKLKEMLRQRGIKEIKTPVLAPMANSICERQIGSVRRECTDHFLFLNERQLQMVLNEYKDYYNESRPHQGIEQKIPVRLRAFANNEGNRMVKVQSTNAVFGLHQDYSIAV